ncbi:MAG: hypothetical protein ACFFFH_00160 [Candidatus Thorarchaeota archaeon]
MGKESLFNSDLIGKFTVIISKVDFWVVAVGMNPIVTVRIEEVANSSVPLF